MKKAYEVWRLRYIGNFSVKQICQEKNYNTSMVYQYIREYDCNQNQGRIRYRWEMGLLDHNQAYDFHHGLDLLNPNDLYHSNTWQYDVNRMLVSFSRLFGN
jgi:hypothetical protein